MIYSSTKKKDKIIKKKDILLELEKVVFLIFLKKNQKLRKKN